MCLARPERLEVFTKRRTEITIETHRWVRISRRETVGLWCGECAAQVEAVSPEQVAQLLRIGTREVYRRIEAGEFHIHEIPAGRLLICLQSIRPGRNYKEKKR